MASVKMSQTIIESIANEVSRSFQARLNQVRKERDNLFTGGDLIRATIENNGGMDLYEKACDNGWLGVVDSYYVTSINGVNISLGYVHLREHNGLRAAPNGGVYAPRMVLDRVRDVQTTDQVIIDKANKYRELCEKEKEIIAELRSAVGAVQAALRSYTTLNKAIKENPTLEGLVPQTYRDKLAEPVTRSPSVSTPTPTVKLDSDLLAKAVVLNKLAQAK